MSGGSYGYVYIKIDEIDISHTETDPRRAAFQKLLKLVANAMHDIEWVDSCDYCKGEEYKSIDEVFSFISKDAETIIKARSYDALKDILCQYLKVPRETKG